MKPFRQSGRSHGTSRSLHVCISRFLLKNDADILLPGIFRGDDYIPWDNVLCRFTYTTASGHANIRVLHWV